MLRSTGILCGTNIDQEDMYKIRVMCNDIQRLITDPEKDQRLMSEKAIKTKARRMLSEALESGTAERREGRTEPGTNESEQLARAREPNFLEETNCGNTGERNENEATRRTSKKAVATFRCRECRQEACGICREDERHHNKTSRCSPTTWDETPHRSNYSRQHRYTGREVMNRFITVERGTVQGSTRRTKSRGC